MANKKIPEDTQVSSEEEGISSNESSAAHTSSPPKNEDSWIDAILRNDKNATQLLIAQEIDKILKRHSLDNYFTVLLFDTAGSIGNFESDRLYEAVSQNSQQKDVLLILHSGGGSIEPAYLISKFLKHFSKSKFSIAVPRRAKSAATLICLGADEIHMGRTSQLGPIDPQIGKLPALGLVQALETLSGLACKFPDASKMLSSYLASQLDLRVLGHFNRVAESAVQYAERLLAHKSIPSNKQPHDIADHLVNHYKDHGFVIDYEEAQKLLGSSFVKVDTKEYAAANDIFQLLGFLEFILQQSDQMFWYTGSIEKGLVILPSKT